MVLICRGSPSGIIRFSPALGLTPVDGKFRRGRQLYRVVSPVLVEVNGAPLTIIEAGFETDLTSWPWWSRWYKPWCSDPRFIFPAVFHDHLLERTGRPKRDVDWLYMGALRACGASALCAFVFWAAVRWKRSRL